MGPTARLAVLLALAAALPVPHAAAACSLDERSQTQYVLSSPHPEVPERAGQELQATIRRTGDLSCQAIVELELLEADLDFDGPTNATLHLGPGQAEASARFRVLDDAYAEPVERFEASASLREGGQDGTWLGYPGILQGRFSIGASDGHRPGTPPLAFFDLPSNRTVTREGQAWQPQVLLTFPPASETVLHVVLANGTCDDCFLWGGDLAFRPGSHRPDPPGGDGTALEAWSPDDGRAEPPKAACLHLWSASLRSGPPQAWLVLDDENRTVPGWNRTALRSAGLDNRTVETLLDPCGNAAWAPPEARPPTAQDSGRDGAARAPSDGGVPADSPLLQPQKEAGMGALLPLLLAILACARRRR